MIFRLPPSRLGTMMKPAPIIVMKAVHLTYLLLLAGFTNLIIPVRAAELVEAVIAKEDVTYRLNGDKPELLEEDIVFPDRVEISTKGTFKVADGKERKLGPGQILRRDGWLVNGNGSVQPVVNHVGMKDGRTYVVRDGVATPLTAIMNFPNGMSVGPDGVGARLPGGRARMLDGQLFRLDGTVIQSKDTVTFKNGRVILQKDGTLITLGSAQMMGMSDGTRVYGRGAIQKPDGTIIELREGQTVLIDGAFYGR